MRPLTAFALALSCGVITGALSAGVGFFILMGGTSPPAASDLQMFALMFPMLSAIALLFVLPTMLVVGVPLTVFLDETGRESFGRYATAGALAGYAVLFMVFYSSDATKAYITALLGLVPGASTSLPWWFLFRRHVALDRAQRSSTSRP